ncbi:MAG: PEP-CTERM sorting domain-containing protein [Planctomycetes bacterium]|nr:PEP-CTERM sorting domain-containing protein [Planctomycetota bacterium]
MASAWGFYHEFGFGVYGIPEPATSVAFLAALVVMARRRSLFSH